MKTLYYGGAFNPPTLAHIELADYARKALGYDRVLFMPSRGSYITGTEKKDFSFDDMTRVAFLRKLAETRPWMEVSDYEVTLPAQPRTYRTLCYLRDHGYPELRLLIGSDWLPSLKNVWKYVPEICREFGIAVMTRADDDLPAMIESDPFLRGLREWLIPVETPGDFREISSGRVRSLLKEIDAFREEKEKCEKLRAEVRALIPGELYAYFGLFPEESGS